MAAADQIQVIPTDSGPNLDIVEGGGSARAVIWPGMGARLRSIHVIELESGARTLPFRHPAEAVYYVTAGSGQALDADAQESQPLRSGAMVHVDGGTSYVLSAGPEGMSLVGGPAPADPAVYEHMS